MTKSPQHSDEIERALAEFRQAEKWLFTLITDPKGERYFQEKSPEVRLAEFREQIERMQSFLDYCGNPEQSFPAIHVAGTSGKGSVVNFLAGILRAGGYRTGYHVSPYLQVCTEKLIVDDQMIRPSEFAGLVADFRHRYEGWLAANDQFSAIKYGEAWVALTFLWMARQNVEWGVIETGLGGRYDPTNVVPSKLAVITNVNFDHMEVLGETLPEIAAHKAGIIKPGGLAITAETNPEVLAIIRAEAEVKGAELFCVGKDFTYQRTDQAGGFSVQGMYRNYSDLHLAMAGEFQVENAALAVAALDLLDGRGMLSLDPTAFQTGMQVEVAGRFEIVQTEPVVVLDGAHNQHKASALAASLAAAFPGKRLTMVLGTLSIKDFRGIIHALAPVTGKWVATQPKVFGKPAAPAAALAEVIRSIAPGQPVLEVDQIPEAVRIAIKQASQNDVVVVTGSLYMLGEARGVWYPVEQILGSLERGER